MLDDVKILDFTTNVAGPGASAIATDFGAQVIKIESQTGDSAQKLAVQIEADARTRAAAMIADAEKQVKLAVGGIQEQTAFEEKRLETAKAATAKFIDAARAICNTQLKNIETVANGILPQSAEAKPAVSVDDTVRSIENSASRIQADPSIQIDIPPVKTAPAAPARQRKLDSTQSFSL